MHELKCCKVKPICRLSHRIVKKIDKIYRIYINDKVINPGVTKSDFFIHLCYFIQFHSRIHADSINVKLCFDG